MLPSSQGLFSVLQEAIRCWFLFDLKNITLIESSWSEMKETAFSISLFLVSSLIK